MKIMLEPPQRKFKAEKKSNKKSEGNSGKFSDSTVEIFQALIAIIIIFQFLR